MNLMSPPKNLKNIRTETFERYNNYDNWLFPKNGSGLTIQFSVAATTPSTIVFVAFTPPAPSAKFLPAFPEAARALKN